MNLTPQSIQTSTTSLLQYSDLHLESKNLQTQAAILASINLKISELKKDGKKVVVALCGDIHNKDGAKEFIGAINAQVVYISGNHEYWSGDVHEVDKSLAQIGGNCVYLKNDLFVFDDLLFVAGVAWSDLAQSINPDMLAQFSGKMNDDYEIKHSQWFESKENVQKIKSLFPTSHEQIINEKRWNILAEIDENQKFLYFIAAFNQIYELLTSCRQEYKTSLKYKLTSAFDPISEQEYNKRIEQADDVSGSLQEYLNNNNHFKVYDYSKPTLALPQDARMQEVIESVWKKLKNISNLESKKIVCMTHHLPFIEQLQQGWHSLAKTNKANMLNSFNKNIYLINSGHEYPIHNYLWRSQKGELRKDEDITRSCHYLNNFSVTLPQNFINKVNVFLHGHEHFYNYQDCIKSSLISANPAGHHIAQIISSIIPLNSPPTSLNHPHPVNNTSLLADLKTQEKSTLSSMAKNFQQNLEDAFSKMEKQDLKEWQGIHKLVVSSQLQKEHLKNCGTAWAAVLFDKKEYISVADKLIFIAKKTISSIAKKEHLLKNNDSSTADTLEVMQLAINALITQLHKMTQSLNEAVDLRVREDYSLSRYSYGLCDKSSFLLDQYEWQISSVELNSQSYHLTSSQQKTAAIEVLLKLIKSVEQRRQVAQKVIEQCEGINQFTTLLRNSELAQKIVDSLQSSRVDYQQMNAISREISNSAKKIIALKKKSTPNTTPGTKK